MPTWATRSRRGPQPGATPVVWKWVAAPTSVITAPDRAREATFWARFQAPCSRDRRIEPSQAKLNWQPVRV
jgi:hypothetical protein